MVSALLLSSPSISLTTLEGEGLFGPGSSLIVGADTRGSAVEWGHRAAPSRGGGPGGILGEQRGKEI